MTKEKEKIRLVWIDLNCSYAHASLALPALHAQIMDRPEFDFATWSVVSATNATPVRDVVHAVVSHRPDVILATLWLFNHEHLLHIVSRVKTLLPTCTVILGGPEFLGDNRTFLSVHRYIDCVMRGEGEEAFPRWLSAYHAPQTWSAIPGLCFFDETGEYRDNGTARVSAFDRLREPEESPFFNWSKPFVQLETTRGCFNTCAFCVSGGEKPVRSLPIERIEKRIENIRAHGIREIRVLDRTFNYQPKRAMALLELFRKFSPDIRFHLEIHPALLPDEIKALLPTLPKNLLHLEAGIQSLREPVLQTVGRAGDLKKSLDGLQFLCRLENMETHADLIAGLPLYTYEALLEDVHTLAAYRAGEIQLESLKLLPGTVMRRDAEKAGIRYSPLPPYEVLETDWISLSDMQRAHYLSRVLDGYYNSSAWQTPIQKIMTRERTFLSRFIDYLTELGLIDQPMSVEKRGWELYRFCRQSFPAYLTDLSVAWIACGLSLRREPAEGIRTKSLTVPAQWRILRGEYRPEWKLCCLPVEKGEYWFGYEPESQNRTPVFIARTE